MFSTTLAVLAVTAVHKEVHEWAGEQQQIGENSKHVRSMFSEKKKGNDRQKDEQHNTSSRLEPSPFLQLIFVIHKTSQLAVAAP